MCVVQRWKAHCLVAMRKVSSDLDIFSQYFVFKCDVLLNFVFRFRIVEYVSCEASKPITFSIDAVPECLTRYTSILRNFTTYMDKNLRPSQGLSPQEVNELQFAAF